MCFENILAYTLLYLHLILLLVSLLHFCLKDKGTHLEDSFLLRCFQQLSLPYIATQRLPFANTITGTPEVRLFWSSRTKKRSSQSHAHTGYGPNCLTTFWTQLACRFNRRTAGPLGPSPAPGCDEPTSRCQTAPSIWTLGRDQPVIPKVPFIRWAMAIPHSTAGSLRPTFVSARLVGLTVSLACAFTLNTQLPTVLSQTSRSSVTL